MNFSVCINQNQIFLMKTFTRLGSFLTIAASLCWGVASAQFICSAPSPIDCEQTVFGTTTGVANDNATSGAPLCLTAVGTGGQYWYSFTPAAGGTCIMSLAGSDFDTKIHVYTGSCGALNCVTGNDDFGGTLQSQVTFNMIGGTTYLIRVGGYLANEGNFQFSVTCDLDTDGCTDQAACNYSADATTDDGSCCYGGCATLVMIDTFGDGWNGASAVITDISTGEILSTSTFTAGAQATVDVCLPVGCYNITVGGGFFDGEIQWEIQGLADGIIAGIANDPTGELFTVGGGQPGCTDPLADNYDDAATCDDGSCLNCQGSESYYTINMYSGGGNGWNGAAWTLLDAGTGTLVDTGNLQGGTTGSYSQCLAPGCYTLNTTAGTQPIQVSWEIVNAAGTVIASGGAGMSIGFSWGGAACEIPGCTDTGCNNYNPNATTDDGSCVCPPSNDDCADATPIGCPSTVNGSTINATLDPTAVSCDPDNAVTAPGVWYTFIGTGDLVNLSTCGSAGGDSKIHVFSGDCSSPVCVTQNDDGCATGLLSSITFTAESGEAYYVLVSEYGTFGDGIDFVLSMECLNCTNSPFNDECANAIPIPSNIDFQQTASLCCTNPDADMAQWAGNGTEYGVWYRINSSNFNALNVTVFNGSGEGVDAADGTDVGIGIFEGGAGCAALNPLSGATGLTTAGLDGFIFSSLADGVVLTPNTNYYICVTTSDLINCGQMSLAVSLTNAGCTDDIACNYCAGCSEDDGSCEYISCGASVPNDLCAGAIPLTCGVDVVGSTGPATNTGAPNVCPAGAGDIGVWYSIVGDGQFVTLSTCGSAIDSRIMVVSSANGCAGPYTCVVSENNDNTTEGCGLLNADDASVQFETTPGTQYYVYITAAGLDTDGDGVNDLTEGAFILSYSCQSIIEGCLDACACNYDPAANVDAGNCDFFSCAQCAAGENAFRIDMTDTFGDGWNNNTYTITDLSGAVVAQGDLDNANCTDGESAGFDVFCLADGCYTITAGGGAFPNEIGWSITDASGAVVIAAVSPNADATFSFTIGGGVCGCTDDGACNYNPAANSDDGSCEFTSCAGCTDNTACNYDATATIEDLTQCCFDNCVTLIMNDTFGDGWNGATATILSSQGEVIGTAGLPAGSNGTASFCLADDCYTIIVGGGTFDNEINWTLTGVTGGVLNGLANDPAGENFSTGGIACIQGCTIPVACNYDPAATIGDCTLCDFSSCSGCTYEEAANYDSAAVVDDGSCDFSGVISDCPADLDGNGSIGVSDLLIFIAAYGTVCPN
jgi:hypothetical protein